MANERRLLRFARAASPKTYYFRVKHRGDYLNLTTPTTYSIVAKAVDPLGNYYTPTVSAKTQVDNDVGVFTVLFTAANLAAARAGRWLLDILIGDSAGNEEPVEARFTFDLQSKETEA